MCISDLRSALPLCLLPHKVTTFDFHFGFDTHDKTHVCCLVSTLDVSALSRLVCDIT